MSKRGGPPTPSNTSPQSQHPQPGSQLNQGQPLAYRSLFEQHNSLQRSEVLLACLSDLAANLRRGCGCSPRHTSHQTASKKGQGLDRARTLQGTKENQPPTRNPARQFLRLPCTTRGDIEQRVSATSRDSSARPPGLCSDIDFLSRQTASPSSNMYILPHQQK